VENSSSKLIVNTRKELLSEEAEHVSDFFYLNLRMWMSAQIARGIRYFTLHSLDKTIGDMVENQPYLLTKHKVADKKIYLDHEVSCSRSK
jgi:hypothetical protein